MSAGSREVVLVTGSSGLLGTAIVRDLGGTYDVVGLDKAGPPYPPKEAECVSMDLTSDAAVARAMERVAYAYGERVASVVHLAAYYSFSGEAHSLYRELTVKGTERLLAALRPFAVEQFVFSSTMLVHAPGSPGRPIDEASPLEPKWPYPESKVEAERLLARTHGETPIVMLRIAGVYDDACGSIPLAQQIRRIYERRMTALVFPGKISHGQAFVHLDDVVRAVRLSIERRARLPSETTLLIGEPETLSYDAIQRRLGRLLHDEEWKTREIPEVVAGVGAWLQEQIPIGEEPFIRSWMVPMADDHYELDISRAERLLGWRPSRSLSETLPKMVRALQADPAGWYERHDLGTPPDVRRREDRPGDSSA